MLVSCDREAEYEISYEVRDVAGALEIVVRDACTPHANAIDDNGKLRRAVRLTPSILHAREVAAYQRALRARHTEEGQCIECVAPAVSGTRRCAKHGGKHRDRERGKRALAKTAERR